MAENKEKYYAGEQLAPEQLAPEQLDEVSGGRLTKHADETMDSILRVRCAGGYSYKETRAIIIDCFNKKKGLPTKDYAPEDLDYFLNYLDTNWPRVREYIKEKYKDW